jgi:hypothetical protein
MRLSLGVEWSAAACMLAILGCNDYAAGVTVRQYIIVESILEKARSDQSC